MGVQDVVARFNHPKMKTINNEVPPLPTTRISFNKNLPPSPIPSPKALMDINNTNSDIDDDDDEDNHSLSGITSLLKKFEKPPMKLPSPPESPLIQKESNKNNNNVTHEPKNSLLFINKNLNDIEDLFQMLISENNAAKEQIKNLEKKVEKYASDATKVKDYEIRVEYLVTKLEQVTEERDFYENELNEQLQTKKEEPKENVERDIQLTMMKYVTDLEKQKLEAKALKEVVKKQDELILKLESKMNNSYDESLLKEQVEIQSIELNNKRELLTQLLNEREDLIRRLNINSPRNSFVRNSYIESYNNRPNSYSSVQSGRGTPPLTAPPKHPLPPLPPQASTSF